MSAPRGVLAVLDHIGYLLDGPASAMLSDARDAVAELLTAEERYSAALTALEDHYRQVADRGYLAARFSNARQLGENFVRAQIRRDQAIAQVAGKASDSADVDPDHAAMLRDSIAQPLDANPPASPASED